MKPQSTIKTVGSVFALYAAAVLLIACGNPSGQFFYGSLGLGDKKILVATANTGSPTIVIYDLEGHFVDVVADFSYAGDIPKGIAPYDSLSFMVLLDGVDRLSKISLTGEPTKDYSDPGLNGTLYQMTYGASNGRYYGIEGNTIEAFSYSGLRVGNPYLGTTINSCVLNVPRGIHATADNRLLVVGTGNDTLNIYNVAGSTPTCVSVNSTIGANDPFAVIQHSDGRILIATQIDDRVYWLPSTGTGTAKVLWATDTNVINNPTALLEMPDGSILVASDLTNSIERISSSGTRIGTTSFIKDAFTGNVTQMMLIGGD